jgi:periplasmic protein CpxP/Spy
MRSTLWNTAILLLAAMPLAAQPGQGPGMGMRPGREPGMGRMFDRLELTDAQKKQVDELRAAHEKKMVQIRSKIEEARIDLRSAMRADAPERSAVEKAIRNVADMQLQSKLERTKFWFDVRALLTPEQAAKVKGMPAPPARRKMRGPMDGRPGMDGCRCMRHGAMH